MRLLWLPVPPLHFGVRPAFSGATPSATYVDHGRRTAVLGGNGTVRSAVRHPPHPREGAPVTGSFEDAFAALTDKQRQAADDGVRRAAQRAQDNARVRP